MAVSSQKKKSARLSEPTGEEKKIKQLENDVYEHTANINNIVDLLELCQSADAEIKHSAAHALHRIFIHFLETGDLAQLKKSAKQAKPVKEDPRAAVRKWLHGQYLGYVKLLLTQLSHPQSAIQVAALHMLMAFVEAEALKLTQTTQHVFPNTLFQRIINALLDNPNFNDTLLDAFMSKYLSKFDDVRYYTYKNISALMTSEGSGQVKCKRKESEVLSTRIVSLLKQINFPTVPEELDAFLGPLGEDNESDGSEEGGAPRKRKAPDSGDAKTSKVLLSLTAHKHVFSDCWLGLLRRPLPDEVYKRVLVIMHKQILPHLVNPRLLIDFLTESYNKGGVISVLALNGLFILMSEHNLDYPDFYKKLYALFDHEMFFVKYRDRFFHLSNIFLRSPLLPSYLVAAFIKRSMRLAVRAPPAGAAFVMPFVYNMLLRHPQCMPMIHRERCAGTDPFDMDECDPSKCNALESSLWELDALQHHYSPTISKFSDVFFNVFQKKEYDVDEFLAQDYRVLFEEEMNRKMKGTTAVEFEKPLGIISGDMQNLWQL